MLVLITGCYGYSLRKYHDIADLGESAQKVLNSQDKVTYGFDAENKGIVLSTVMFLETNQELLPRTVEKDINYLRDQLESADSLRREQYSTMKTSILYEAAVASKGIMRSFTR